MTRPEKPSRFSTLPTGAGTGSRFNHTLDGEDVIPGFSLKVADIFS